ncbi:Bug family tripartite tricarboxylate transporter substrate binding protein [Azohydromonas lata]|uniref:Tripartite tricarboxylate transporter substrate binding protein n=1 Tax=Azohydromonas lata TaxID=45677 RepID=A0ABU5IES4_9BURK|nr:tripartite tricarboxylate transporter substrate binding protein [Azohydromonas lata]MDZ5457329.1 tripartite tricarboxylate transporter substrate binding protein [Azohydromonas lata]
MSHDTGGRTLLTRRACVALAAGLLAPAVRAQQPVLRWIVPFPPGGGSDLSTRIVAKRVAELTGRTIVIDNKPGAATMIGAQELVRSKPDGLTLMTAGMSTLALNPGLYASPGYQADKDFAHVSTLVRLPMVLAVHAAHPAATLKDLVAWLRARGSKASYASTGSGTPQHVAMALWLEQQGLETVHVPYKSMPGALQDLAGGQLDLMFGDVSAAAPLIRAGRLKPLAVPSGQRSPVLPDVPTFAQAGMPCEAAAWQGVVMPAGTPADVVERMSAAVRTALVDPATAEQLLHHGMEPLGSTPQDFGHYAAEERQRWLRVIQAHRITVG